MHVKHLECVDCAERYPKDAIIYRCKCGGHLKIVYDYDAIKRRVSWGLFRKRPFQHWRYSELFPLEEEENRITLGEGGTPLVRAKNLSQELGFEHLYLKLENKNPTGSFKDRGTTVEISKAIEFDAKEVVCASTGNMGASIAFYAEKAGIKARILVPKHTSPEKINYIGLMGAEVDVVDGDYTKTAELAYREFEKRGTYLMGDYLYRGEGEKSIAFEIADELIADYVFVPIGNGTLLKGTWRGYVELEKVGLASKKPKLVGAQASGSSTVARAFKKHTDTIKPVHPKTIADAIACGNPLDGREALDAIIESKGSAEEVSDGEIIAAQRMLLEREGVDAEPAGAVALAVLLKLRGSIEKKAKIVLLVTGSGHKIK